MFGRERGGKRGKNERTAMLGDGTADGQTLYGRYTAPENFAKCELLMKEMIYVID